MSKRKLIPKNLDNMLSQIESNSKTHENGDPVKSPHFDECKDLIEKWDNVEEVKGTEFKLSIEQAAEMLGVSTQTLRNWEIQGKLIPQRTSGGHRRYFKSQIIEIRKKQLSIPEIILPDITPIKLRQLGETLLSNFRDDEKVSLIISQGTVDGKIRITMDSEDGLTTICKTFNMEE